MSANNTLKQSEATTADIMEAQKPIATTVETKETENTAEAESHQENATLARRRARMQRRRRNMHKGSEEGADANQGQEEQSDEVSNDEAKEGSELSDGADIEAQEKEGGCPPNEGRLLRTMHAVGDVATNATSKVMNAAAHLKDKVQHVQLPLGAARRNADEKESPKSQPEGTDQTEKNLTPEKKSVTGMAREMMGQLGATLASAAGTLKDRLSHGRHGDVGEENDANEGNAAAEQTAEKKIETEEQEQPEPAPAAPEEKEEPYAHPIEIAAEACVDVEEGKTFADAARAAAAAPRESAALSKQTTAATTGA